MSDPAETVLIGVDGGGTGCRAAIGTAAQGVLATATGGPANVSSDPAQAIANVMAAIHAAASKANISARAVSEARVHLGLAGVMTMADSLRTAAALPFQNITVTDDRATSVTGALGGEDGFLLSIGTGTIVAANKGGAHKFVGGWGLQVSDQSSGAWLGRAALAQVLLCHDKMAEHSDLTHEIFATFHHDPNEIVAMSLAAKPADYAAFAPDVVAAAKQGDAIGRMLMEQGADYLARALGALGFQAGDALCLTGGIGPHYAAYLSNEILTGQITPRGTALDGAFLLAQATPI